MIYSKKVFYSLILLVVILMSCKKEKSNTDFLLLSDREAPLGWIYFTIYKDSSFEYTSRGLTDKTVFQGKALITTDTIYLSYKDSIPNVGRKVFYTKDYIEFIELNNSRLMTRLNKLK